MFGAISTIFRYVVIPYCHLFCGKKSGDALVDQPFNLTLLYSSPYLFIIFFGYYCFDSNIGIYAIVGSDAYSYLIIPALVIFFGRGLNTVDKWIYSRDVLFSNLGLALLYQFVQKDEVEYVYPIILIVPLFIYIGL